MSNRETKPYSDSELDIIEQGIHMLYEQQLIVSEKAEPADLLMRAIATARKYQAQLKEANEKLESLESRLLFYDMDEAERG